MSNSNALIDKIRKLSPSREILRSLPSQESQVMTVNFEGDRVGLLDLSYPPATVWARMVDYLQRNNRPVYVEIDSETNIITKLSVPEAAKVWRINESEEAVYVTFYTSQARHYLPRNHPDFQKMLNELQAALANDAAILVTSTQQNFEIIDVRPLPQSFGIDRPTEPPAPSAPDPPVTWDRAVELFNLMQAKSCVPCSSTDPCIPYKFPYNGCWIRAHLMCYLMIAEGETPEKIWIDSAGCNLLAPSSNVPECEVHWCWHVAPTLMVQQPSGPDLKMVIDPSLCDKPVTPDEWRLRQTDTSATLTPSLWEQYWPSGGTATQAQANNDMEQYRILLDGLCQDYGPSPYACPIVKSCHFIVDRSTFGEDEIAAMLKPGQAAVIEAAFYVIVDGFSAQELGITSATLFGVPNIKPALTIAPSIAQMTAEAVALDVEDPSHLKRRQRLTWTYQISFTGTDGFVNDVEDVTLTALIATVSSSATIYLIKQPNPYEVDGPVSWLSGDLRVFQIKAGESQFGKTMGNAPDQAPDFIEQVIANLNNGTTGGQTFDDISIDQQTSKLELSEKVKVNGTLTPVFNFAIARVHYRSKIKEAKDVRVFFRLFPASTTSLEYNQSTTYRRGGKAGTIIPLLGIQGGIAGGEVISIPCFAAPRIDSSDPTKTLNDQPDPANVQTLQPDTTGAESYNYFGCWLDINQSSQPQFPFQASPMDGPYPAADRKTIYEHIRNKHQCLVAEIAFDPDPIPPNATPGSSDKLAQRNLMIVESPNPGNLASRRIPNTFDIRPTRANLGPDEIPDELMIDWGNTPVGSLATLYLPSVSVTHILEMAVQMYRSHRLIRIDDHTLRCPTDGITYIPIPPGSDTNLAGLLSIDLPPTVRRDEVFTVVVRQVTSTGKELPIEPRLQDSPSENLAIVEHSRKWRRILGTFQLTIPVRTKEEMLGPEERILSNLRWVQQSIPENNRWFPVFNRYVEQIANRVDALGGDSSQVEASPTGDWQKVRLCRTLAIICAVSLTIFIVALGIMTNWVTVAVIAVFLAVIALTWVIQCQPNICSKLRVIVAGAGIGALILAILVLLGASSPQLVPVLCGAVALTAIASLIGRSRKCF
ncbi:MAG: hypothetical protein IM496_10925 [Microcystis sp. M049S2]|jgi:hypothetical protein|uniref:Protein glutaminase domain-containing protein n=2 Tax=Microcystis TaxID=1125 RepID=I4FXV0_MICAE|nr:MULTISPECIES: protein-glutamine glutaminase family protein [Microcystis]MCA2658997.1 hypothetical protein [Microcystis sp. M049S2]CCI00511.1 membrane hypothetical protein [Microcystis aeruginosa PCC 9717]